MAASGALHTRHAGVRATLGALNTCMRVLTTTPLLLSPQVCERRWGRAFARLSAEAPDGRLEALELSDTQPGVEPLQAVQLAAAAPAQRALRRRVLAALADAAPPPGLASVAMRGVGLGDAERQLLLRLVRHHPRLATLDIRHNALSPPAVEELGRLVSACNRERLAAGIAAPLTLLCQPMLARPALAGEAGGQQPRFGSAQHWGTRALVYAAFALLAALTVADVRSLHSSISADLPHSPAGRLWKGSKGLQWPAMPPPPPPPPLPPLASPRVRVWPCAHGEASWWADCL